MDNNLAKLHGVCSIAVEYVGSANYQHRETHAMYQVHRAFAQYDRGEFDKMVFCDMNKNCGCRYCQTEYKE